MKPEVKTSIDNKKLIREIAEKLKINDPICIGETDDTLTFSGVDSESGFTLEVVIQNIETVVTTYAPVVIKVEDAEGEIKTKVKVSETASSLSTIEATKLSKMLEYVEDEEDEFYEEDED